MTHRLRFFAAALTAVAPSLLAIPAFAQDDGAPLPGLEPAPSAIEPVPSAAQPVPPRGSESSDPPRIVLAAPSAPTLAGRSFHYHDGFYLRTSLNFGFYGGGVSVGDAQSPTEVEFDGSGLDASILIGGTPSPGLSVGGGIQAGSLLRPSFERDGEALGSRNVGFLLIGPFVDGFPKANGGWHLGGMLGLGGIGKTTDTEASAGFGGAAWVGYDTWVGADWSVGGLLRFSALATQGDEPEDFSGSLIGVSLGVSVLYH